MCVFVCICVHVCACVWVTVVCDKIQCKNCNFIGEPEKASNRSPMYTVLNSKETQHNPMNMRIQKNPCDRSY